MEINKEEAIIQFQNYSGNIISRMSNLGFAIKTFCFSYISILFIFLSFIYNDNISCEMILFLFTMNLLIIFSFSLLNSFFLSKERLFKEYQKEKIKNYKSLNFNEIICFNPGITKNKMKTFFSITIFWFYFLIFLFSSIMLLIVLV